MTEGAKREGIMLAYPGDEGRIRRLGDSFFAQPKLKGERCRVEWFKDEPVLLSSEGNEFNCLPNIKHAIFKSGLTKVPLDGELYVHGMPFDGKEGIHSICSRRTNMHPNHLSMEYHIFDIQWEDQSQWFRTLELKRWQDSGYLTDPLKIVVTKVVNSETWLELMTEWVHQGYEGIILRSPIALYVPKRNVGLIKVKPTEEDEYQIVLLIEAVDKYGTPKGMVGSFRVQDKEGIHFSVGAGKMKHKERIELWQNWKDICGKTLIVKHEPEVTKGGIPVCAVAVRIKPGEEVKYKEVKDEES